jgi:hypothetical protein
VGGTCDTHGRGELSVQVFGGKTRREETTWKTKAYMGGWDEIGPQGDRLRGRGVD